MATINQNKQRAAGIAICLMLLLAIAHGLDLLALPGWLAGAAGWIAAGLLITSLSVGQRAQIAVLMLAGIGVLIVAVALGSMPQWLRLIDANANLLTMIAAVSFLRLVAVPDTQVAGEQPVGIGAFRRTMLSVAVFGSFINLSAPILITDRLASYGPIQRFTSQSVTRVFSGCSAWSPFFGGMAVVLTYLPDTRLPFVMAACLPFAVVGLVLVIFEASVRYPSQLRTFRGYSFTLSSLWVPVALALLVVGSGLLFPDVSVLLTIALSSLVLTLLVLLLRYRLLGSSRRLVDHICTGLPTMAGELLLFTSAGVLAVGLTALVNVGSVTLPVDHFSANFACAILVAIMGLSMIGIHPVISIAGFTPLLMPLQPPIELLAVTYLLSWSLGTTASPLSGTHVVFQGRYGVPAVRAAMWNWPFALVMCGCGFVVLHVVARIA